MKSNTNNTQADQQTVFTYSDSVAGKQTQKFSSLKEIKEYIENFGWHGDSEGTVFKNGTPICEYMSREDDLHWSLSDHTPTPQHTLNEGLHTPGIWKVDDIFSSVFGYEVVDNNGNTIADCFKNSYYKNRPDGRERGKANAEHIVKCVNLHNELVNALNQAVNVIKEWHQADEVFDIYYKNAPEMKVIRETLSKVNQ